MYGTPFYVFQSINVVCIYNTSKQKTYCLVQEDRSGGFKD